MQIEFYKMKLSNNYQLNMEMNVHILKIVR